MAEFTRSTITTKAATIEVLMAGEGPAIVLLPSLGRGAEDMLGVGGHLVAHGYRVICPQPRGIGASTGPMSDVTLHDLAADIADIVAQLGVAPVVAAGHAFGNKVARTFAADHPEQTRAVVMLAGAGRAPIPDDVRRSIMGSGDLALPDAERIEHLQRAFFAPGNDPSVWLGGWYPPVKAMELGAEQSTPPDDFIGAGRAPICDVQARQDTVVPESARQDLRNELGDRVTTVVIERAGHALLPEQPLAVARAMHAYIAAL